MTPSTCPKCGHRRGLQDGHVHPGICPACGIAMGKWRARQMDEVQVHGANAATLPGQRDDTGAGAREYLLALPPRTDKLSLYGRAVLWLGLLLWGLWFLFQGLDWEVIGGSFMHQINLPFHEFGHVLFMPFGRFMSILGGSLFQIALPIALALVFVIRQRDNFAASVCLWWCGQSWVDLSPYIADAPYRLLPLVGGMDESGHDWGNMLGILGLTDWALTLARCSFALGCLTMAAALFWGWQVLLRQYRRGGGVGLSAGQ